MVRINLIPPRYLADQHLVAEYNEILMLIGHVKKFPKIRNQPEQYCLGPGHINFFKNKLKYLQDRHEFLKKEMIKRDYKPTKSIDLTKFDKELVNDWKPREKDYKIIKKRLIEKINLKPDYYRYYKEKKGKKFLVNLIKKAN